MTFNRWVCRFMVLIAFATARPAVSQSLQVAYTGGTAAVTEQPVAGNLEPDGGKALSFLAPKVGFAIPYAGITDAAYREENRFRLGVLPAIAVGLIKARARRHLVIINWKDDSGLAQTAVFETSKETARTMLALLRARSPQVCPPKGSCLAALPY
jgi:hypothetical protein